MMYDQKDELSGVGWIVCPLSRILGFGFPLGPMT